MLKAISKTIWLALISLVLCTQPLWGGTNAPDWVHQLASQTLPKYEPDTNAVVLLDQTDFTVTGPGEYLEHSRWVVKILRQEGQDKGILKVELEQKEKLLNIHAWSIDATGHEYELKDKDFIEKNPYSDALYDDIKLRTTRAPASEPGSVIAIEYEARRHGWMNQINLFYQEDVPVREARISLALPQSWEYKTSWTTPTPIEATAAGQNKWQWSIHDIPAIEHEPMMPAFPTLAARLEISYFTNGEAAVGSWDRLGRWYIELTGGRRNPTPELSDKAHQLTAGKTDFDGKVKALASFLQSEVRYVAIEMGIGGYQPHTAGDTFHARYGDCKDKATLLSSMLQEVGIHSSYVLIDTDRGFVNPTVPSPMFDHAILAIELPAEIKTDAYRSVITAKTGKRYLIFDPTDTYTPLGELRSQLQNTYALLVADTGGELFRTPFLAANTNGLIRTGHFILNSNGTLSGEVMEDRSGDHAFAERLHLVSATQQQRSQELERRLSRSLQGFTVQSSDIEHLDQLQQDLVYNFKFTNPQYGQIRGPLMLVRPRVLGEKSFPVERARKPRQYPVELYRASRETDTYEIEIPQDYKVDDIPDPVKIDVGFASYQSKVEVEGSKLRYWREYIVRDLSVNPDHLADWTKLQGVIGADETAAVVLKRAQ